jgi:hypothetical protein
MLTVLFLVINSYCLTLYVSYSSDGKSDTASCGEAKTSPCKTIEHAMDSRGGTDIIIIDDIRLTSNLSKSGTIRSESNSALVKIDIRTGGYFDNGPYEFKNIQFIFQSSSINIFRNIGGTGYILIDCVLSELSKKTAYFFYLNGGTHSLTNCTISNIINAEVSCKGGFFFLDGLGSIELNECKVDSCETNNTNTFGGVIFCSSNIDVTIVSCIFNKCKAVGGGGVLATNEGCGETTSSKIIITSCTFEECSVSGSNSRGGAIFVCLFDKRTLLIDGNCVFKNCTANSASGRGGAIYLKLCGTSNDVEYIYRLEGTTETFDSNCGAKNGSHIFIEYLDGNDYGRVIDVNSYRYTYGTTEATICMMSTDDSSSLQSVIPFLLNPPTGECSDISQLGQCTSAGDKECIWISGESEGQRCQEVKTSCEEILTEAACEQTGAAKSGSTTCDCFWLYSGSSGSTGSCKDKNDNSLSCADAKRPNQCTNTNIVKLGTNCLWWLGNSSTPHSSDSCVDKVRREIDG